MDDEDLVECSKNIIIEKKCLFLTLFSDVKYENIINEIQMILLMKNPINCFKVFIESVI